MVAELIRLLFSSQVFKKLPCGKSRDFRYCSLLPLNPRGSHSGRGDIKCQDLYPLSPVHVQRVSIDLMMERIEDIDPWNVSELTNTLLQYWTVLYDTAQSSY